MVLDIELEALDEQANPGITPLSLPCLSAFLLIAGKDFEGAVFGEMIARRNDLPALCGILSSDHV